MCISKENISITIYNLSVKKLRHISSNIVEVSRLLHFVHKNYIHTYIWTLVYTDNDICAKQTYFISNRFYRSSRTAHYINRNSV